MNKFLLFFIIINIHFIYYNIYITKKDIKDDNNVSKI